MGSSQFIHHDRALRLFLRALNGGAVRDGLSSCTWSVHGDCEFPEHIEVVGRPRTHGGDPFRADKFFSFVGRSATVIVRLSTRCRKCHHCRRHRTSQWRYRILTEYKRAARTWVGTLTLSPERQYYSLVEARAEALARGVPWQSLSAEERFQRHALFQLKEVTRYVKRFRKECKVPFRYFVVTERHKSGLPHFHMLVHETTLRPIKHKTLSDQWNWGFERWRLADENPRSVTYVAKYLTKDMLSRVRSSQHYGKQQETTSVGGILASLKDALGQSEVLNSSERDKARPERKHLPFY